MMVVSSGWWTGEQGRRPFWWIWCISSFPVMCWDGLHHVTRKKLGLSKSPCGSGRRYRGGCLHSPSAVNSAWGQHLQTFLWSGNGGVSVYWWQNRWPQTGHCTVFVAFPLSSPFWPQPGRGMSQKPDRWFRSLESQNLDEFAAVVCGEEWRMNCRSGRPSHHGCVALELCDVVAMIWRLQWVNPG